MQKDRKNPSLAITLPKTGYFPMGSFAMWRQQSTYLGL